MLESTAKVCQCGPDRATLLRNSLPRRHRMAIRLGPRTSRGPPAGLSRWSLRSVSYRGRSHPLFPLRFPHVAQRRCRATWGKRSGKRKGWLSGSQPTTFTSGTRPLGSSSLPYLSDVQDTTRLLGAVPLADRITPAITDSRPVRSRKKNIPELANSGMFWRHGRRRCGRRGVRDDGGEG